MGTSPRMPTKPAPLAEMAKEEEWRTSVIALATERIRCLCICGSAS